jgi:hypothetical protein
MAPHANLRFSLKRSAVFRQFVRLSFVLHSADWFSRNHPTLSERFDNVCGHWLNPDGSRNDATVTQQRKLYTLEKKRRFAQGIEAATAAETVKLGSVHESPVGNADAPKGVGHE